MNTTTMPRVGEKVIAVHVPGRPEYDGKVCTVTSVGRTDIYGEFQSITKPDDTEEFVFLDWQYVPADQITWETRDRMIGKTIRVIYSGSTRVAAGEIHTVTGVWPHRESRYATKVDGITVGVTVDGHSGQWVQEYEVIEDGHTLTVSEYVPEIGDYVTVTGVLTDDGIVDQTFTGTVVESSGGVYVVQTRRTDSVVTGPGYVEKADSPDERFGTRVKITDEYDAPSSLLGKEGIITGDYHNMRVEITFPRGEVQYGGTFPGSWVYPTTAYEIVPALGDGEHPVIEEVRAAEPVTFVEGERVLCSQPNIDIREGEGPFEGVYQHSGPDGLHWVTTDAYRGGIYYRVVEKMPQPEAIDAPEVIVNLTEEIGTLKRELERANERVTEATTRAGKWERDFNRYAAAILQQAKDRRWCDEYERVMREIQDDLEIAEIPERRNRRRITVRVEGTSYREFQVWVDEDEDSDDPDNWYEDENDDDPLGNDGADERLQSEYDNVGFDSIEYSSI